MINRNSAKELEELFEILLIFLDNNPYKENRLMFENYQGTKIKLTIGNKSKVFTKDLNDVLEVSKFISPELYKKLFSRKNKRKVKRKKLHKNDIIEIN